MILYLILKTLVFHFVINISPKEMFEKVSTLKENGPTIRVRGFHLGPAVTAQIQISSRINWE